MAARRLPRLLAGLVVAVHQRVGPISRLSWLDAAMGASAVGALTAAFGAKAPVTVAAGGIAGILALGRWRPSRTLLLGAAGLALLGAGVNVAAVPLLLAGRPLA